jgi:four helix bundle protein
MSYHNLEVYKRSYRLAIEIHKFSSTLPKYLQFDLADQIRRASRSIASNISEGYGRNISPKDKINFLRMSLGSNDEVIFNLNFLKDIDLMKQDQFDYFHQEYIICGKQLTNLIKSISNQ